MYAAFSDFMLALDKLRANLQTEKRYEEIITHYMVAHEMAIALYEQTSIVKDLVKIVASCEVIGDCKFALDLHEEALIYRLKTLEYFNRHIELDPSMKKHESSFLKKLIASYNSMGDYLNEIGQPEKADKYYQLARDTKGKINPD